MAPHINTGNRMSAVAAAVGAEGWVACDLCDKWRRIKEDEVAQYERCQRRRLSMRPGLTCLWQVSGRNRIDFERWMELATSRDASADDRARAARCLQRYVHPDIYPKGDAVDWARWYAQHRDRIAFVDSAGFYWVLDPTVG